MLEMEQWMVTGGQIKWWWAPNAQKQTYHSFSNTLSMDDFAYHNMDTIGTVGSFPCEEWWILCFLQANHTSKYRIYTHWNEIYSLSFFYDICNEVHEHMKWLSELWWDHNIVITSLLKYVLNIPFMGYLIQTSNYLQRIFDLAHEISMVDHLAISVETPRIHNGWFCKKWFIELIHMNPKMVLYITIN